MTHYTPKECTVTVTNSIPIALYNLPIPSKGHTNGRDSTTASTTAHYMPKEYRDSDKLNTHRSVQLTNSK